MWSVHFSLPSSTRIARPTAVKNLVLLAIGMTESLSIGPDDGLPNHFVRPASVSVSVETETQTVGSSHRSLAALTAARKELSSKRLILFVNFEDGEQRQTGMPGKRASGARSRAAAKAFAEGRIPDQTDAE